MIYFIILIILVILSIKFDFRSSGSKSDFWYHFALILLIAVAGFRYKVGADTLSYFASFDQIPFLSELINYNFSRSQYNPLWIILSSFSKSLINDFAFFQIIQASIVNIIIFKFINKHTIYRFTAVLVYYMFLYLYFNMEIMRESLAICTFLLAYPFLKNRNWFKYYLLAGVAFLFHSSACIVFIFPFLINKKFDVKNIYYILFLAFGIIFVFFQLPFLFNYALDSVEISDKFYLYSQFTTNYKGALMAFFLYGLVPFLVIKNYTKNRKEQHIFSGMYSIYFFLVIIYVPISGFGRLLNYVAPFMMIYFADFLHTIYLNKKFYRIKELAVITTFVIFFVPNIIYYTTDTSVIYHGTHKYNAWYPYSSIFAPKEYRFRYMIHNAATGGK